jgi:hypothetical protein
MNNESKENIECLTKLLEGFSPFDKVVVPTPPMDPFENKQSFDFQPFEEKKEEKEEKIIPIIQDCESQTHLSTLCARFRSYQTLVETRNQINKEKLLFMEETMQKNWWQINQELMRTARIVITDYRKKEEKEEKKGEPKDKDTNGIKTFFCGTWLDFFESQTKTNFRWLREITDTCANPETRWGCGTIVDLSGETDIIESVYRLKHLSEMIQQKIRQLAYSTCIVVHHEALFDKEMRPNVYTFQIRTTMWPISFDIQENIVMTSTTFEPRPNAEGKICFQKVVLKIPFWVNKQE